MPGTRISTPKRAEAAESGCAPRVGIHTSIAKSLENAALTAARIGANAVQIFSASPRMWRACRPDPDDVGRMRAAREKHDVHPLVIHDNYLINMASCTEELRAKSAAAFRGEIERALAIGADYLVAHPGNCKGHTVAMGIEAFCRSLGEAARGLDTRRLTMLIENTAGSGNALGSRLEELAAMKRYAAEFTDLKVGFCIDTCHLHAAGFDIARDSGLRATIAELDAILGLRNIPVFHANDSKTPLGSRVDRHEQIGRGHIGKEGFRRILTHPRLRAKTFIAETPVENPGDDRRNVRMLQRLAGRTRKPPRRSG
jgi:deoxyribonuclease IV